MVYLALKFNHQVPPVISVSCNEFFSVFRLLMCSNNEELYRKAKWNGKSQQSRQRLMEKIQGW